MYWNPFNRLNKIDGVSNISRIETIHLQTAQMGMPMNLQNVHLKPFNQKELFLTIADKKILRDLMILLMKSQLLLLQF